MPACRCLIEKSLSNKRTSAKSWKYYLQVRKPIKILENSIERRKPIKTMGKTRRSHLQVPSHVCMSMSHRKSLSNRSFLQEKSQVRKPTKILENSIERRKPIKTMGKTWRSHLQVPSHVCMSMSHRKSLSNRSFLQEKSRTSKKTYQNPREIALKEENLSKPWGKPGVPTYKSQVISAYPWGFSYVKVLFL